MSVDRWIDKEDMVCTMEYYSAIKKEIMPFGATWVQLEISILILSEANHK